jgi:hypothetical protein
MTKFKQSGVIKHEHTTMILIVGGAGFLGTYVVNMNLYHLYRNLFL